MKQLLLATFICFVTAIIVNPQAALAHRMDIEQIEDGRIQVHYDDGTGAAMTVVSAFDEDGELLFERTVDENGQLSYDEEMAIYRFVADDGMGHRATYVMDETANETNWLDTIPMSIRALTGVSFLLFIAAIFVYRTRK